MPHASAGHNAGVASRDLALHPSSWTESPWGLPPLRPRCGAPARPGALAGSPLRGSKRLQPAIPARGQALSHRRTSCRLLDGLGVVADTQSYYASSGQRTTARRRPPTRSSGYPAAGDVVLLTLRSVVRNSGGMSAGC